MLIPSVILSNSLPLQHFTAHTSVASAVCCPLSLLCCSSIPLQLFSFFFYYFFHCHEAASSGWRHSHTNMATLEGTQRGGRNATSQPASPPSLEKGRRHRKCQVNNPKHTPYGTSSRGTPMLQIPSLSLLKNNAHG